jgi:3-dehydroquinate synthase
VAGFVAATLLRGVNFVQVPTTLLADVDSSVGGKTGVDHAAGKNLIGAFHQPKVVLIDPGALATLPGVEISSGMAECIKHGVIRDAWLLGWIEKNADKLRAGDAQALAELISRNVTIKAAIVAADEHERDRGPRSHLNFGHTIGHAIEAACGFGAAPLSLNGRGWPAGPGEGAAQGKSAASDYLRHGHCVALGMVAADQIALSRGLLPADEAARVESLLARFDLPVRLSGLSADALLATMRHDKKARTGRLRFVLPAVHLGTASVHDDVLESEIRAAIEYLSRS